jgi:hypothetical protein
MVKMTTRSRRRLLWTLNLLLAVALAAIAWVAVRGVPRLTAAGEALVDPAGQGSAAPHAGVGPLADYLAVADRPLQKPLFDPKPIVAEIKAQPKPPLRIRLTGTAVDPGYVAAFFTTSQGEMQIARVGETVDGAKVLEITASSATVEWYGDQKQLSVEGSP